VGLDVERVVVAELILAGAARDLAADAQPVGEACELYVRDLDGHREVFALAAGIAHLVVVPLDAPGGVAGDEIARFEDVGEMPEVVDGFGRERQPLAAGFALPAARNSHSGYSGGAVTTLAFSLHC